MKKALSNKIYYASFVLAVLVIGLHSSFVGYLDPDLAYYSFALAFHRVFLTIGDAAVPTFFLVSSYLLFSKFRLVDYPKMLFKKVFSLVIPYFIWSILGFLFARIILPLCNHETIELSFLSVCLDILLAKSCPQIWFVRTLMAFFIASPIFYFIFRCLKRWSIVIPVIVFVVYLFFRPDYFGIVFWIPLLFVGSYLSYFNVPVMNPYKPRILSIFAMITLISMATMLSIFNVKEEGTLYFCYRHASTVLIWLSLDILRSFFLKEDIKEVFQLSALMFFSHVFIAWSVSFLLRQIIPLDSNMKCILCFFLTWMVSTLCCIGLGYILKRFVHPLYRCLGGRH